MKTKIKYVNVNTWKGQRLANLLLCQGWRIVANTPYGVKFYKIYLK